MITEQQINGCDNKSRIYFESFNMLQPLINIGKKKMTLDSIKISLNNMDSFDRSALGLYIGKFVEQEINSSVVQLMRQYVDIDMPDYYCKRNPSYDVDAIVKSGNKKINLNAQGNKGNSYSLQTLPLGDAYYALEALKEEAPDFFDDYQWLNAPGFLDSWRQLFMFRNQVAHIGTIISHEEISNALSIFERFLTYMPQIMALKEELAPDDSTYATPVQKPKAQETEEQEEQLPPATPEDYKRYCELLGKDLSDESFAEINELKSTKSFFTQVITGPDGKKGLRHPSGKILVPTIYEGIAFTHDVTFFDRAVVVACQDGKEALVKADGTGEKITDFLYDSIGCAEFNSGYFYYRRGGSLAYGIMKYDGKEIIPCIIDKHYEPFSTCMIFKTGYYYGLWDFGEKILMPIFENIEYDVEEPLMFTLNGERGFMDISDYDNWHFLPLRDLEAIEDEDELHDKKLDCLFPYIDE